MLLNGQQERLEGINRPIFNRYKPDVPLQPNIDFRPASTKYAKFPALDARRKTTVPIQQQPAHHTTNGPFTPPVGKLGPVSGFVVDDESQLQNRFFALQKHGAGMQNTYIPQSQSDLYKSIPVGENKEEKPSQELKPQKHDSLFKPYPQPVTTIVPEFVAHMSKKPFSNFTRMELRSDVTDRIH